MKKLILASAMVLAPLGAFAADDVTENKKLIEKTTLTLVEAIQKASGEVAGTAISAELDDHRGEPRYDIEVLTDAAIFDITIDGATGNVLEVKKDVD